MKWLIIFLFTISFYKLPALSNTRYFQDTSRINTSIEKAINYLNYRILNKQLYFYIVPILMPIATYYKLPIDTSFYYFNDYEKKLIELYRPIYKKRDLSSTDKKIIDSLSVIDQLIMFALYGNKLYSKNYFKTYMDSLIRWGQYDLTHAYFIALLLKNKKYIPKAEINLYISKIQHLMTKLLPKVNEHFNDLNIEVIAFLLYSNYNLNEVYILNMINQQTPEGSWKDKPDHENQLMDDHSTVLALWALLEWKYKSDSTLYLAHPAFIDLNSK